MFQDPGPGASPDPWLPLVQHSQIISPTRQTASACFPIHSPPKALQAEGAPELFARTHLFEPQQPSV